MVRYCLGGSKGKETELTSPGRVLTLSSHHLSVRLEQTLSATPGLTLHWKEAGKKSRMQGTSTRQGEGLFVKLKELHRNALNQVQACQAMPPAAGPDQW